MLSTSKDLMSRTNSNFFACFKPVVADDQPSFVSSPPSEDKSGGGRRRKAVTRTFSRAMKAVFFKTSLVKKIRIRKSRQEHYRSSGNLSSSKHEKFINKMKMNSSYQEFSDTEGIFRTNSNRSSLFTSTSPSSASSVSSNSRSGSKRIKESTSLDDLKQINRKNRKQNGGSKRIYNSTNGMYIIFVCLVAVVFLGKAFAIVACTSTWLFLAPCSHRRSEVVDSPIKEVVNLKEHKKRVIMEGLLDRNRPRVVGH
ncbi:hypothetical protein BUALT_Bualt03G0129100 [Buddleja alternifolia]|uniref:Transmembrane protein n=1 Tax=Buddleja alternifolia TaxID=168488 RepID=A0AAV6Y001_9LAMI|nr:hypothetical protein BUALT_Bualt03G0129100 [Buddleja alternifolia]